jgi:hypothetical protein
MEVRVFGLWLESVLCSGYGGRIWGRSILASSYSVWIRRILSSKLGPLAPALGPLASRRRMSGCKFEQSFDCVMPSKARSRMVSSSWAARVVRRPFHVRPQFSGKLPEYPPPPQKVGIVSVGRATLLIVQRPFSPSTAVPIGRGNPGSGSLIPLIDSCRKPAPLRKAGRMVPRPNARLGTRKSSCAGSGKLSRHILSDSLAF